MKDPLRAEARIDSPLGVGKVVGTYRRIGITGPNTEFY
jgi:hypothetical protein